MSCVAIETLTVVQIFFWHFRFCNFDLLQSYNLHLKPSLAVLINTHNSSTSVTSICECQVIIILVYCNGQQYSEFGHHNWHCGDWDIRWSPPQLCSYHRLAQPLTPCDDKWSFVQVHVKHCKLQCKGRCFRTSLSPPLLFYHLFLDTHTHYYYTHIVMHSCSSSSLTLSLLSLALIN